MKQDPIFVGADLEAMLRMDVKAEEEAMLLYKQIIRVEDKEGDITTKTIRRNLGSRRGTS